MLTFIAITLRALQSHQTSFTDLTEILSVGRSIVNRRLIQSDKISEPMISSVLENIPVRIYHRFPVLTGAL
jgi:hypothetical protein